MSKAHSRFIAGEDVGVVTDWQFSAVDQSSIRFAAKLKAQEETEAQSRAEGARQAGFAAGYAEGFAQGHAQATLEGQRLIADYIANEGAQAASTFATLFVNAQQRIADADQAIAQGVLELACEIARQVARRDLAVNPNALQPVIREGLGMLLTDGKAATVRINPLDLDVLSEALQQEFSGASLNLVADASLTRGGCLVESAGTVIDGTVERRWQRAVSTLGLESAWEAEHDEQ